MGVADMVPEFWSSIGFKSTVEIQVQMSIPAANPTRLLKSPSSTGGQRSWPKYPGMGRLPSKYPTCNEIAGEPTAPEPAPVDLAIGE
jgi:hypothetical protein